MSTTGSPWRKTATDAPTSAPESSWSARVVAYRLEPRLAGSVHLCHGAPFRSRRCSSAPASRHAVGTRRCRPAQPIDSRSRRPAVRPRGSVTSAHAAPGSCRGGLGAERARGGAHPGPGRASRSRSSRARPRWGAGRGPRRSPCDGFRHDVCSAVHPSLVASPFFVPSTCRLSASCCASRTWPTPTRSAAAGRPRCTGSVEETAAHLGGDAAAYRGPDGSARALAGPDRALRARSDAHRAAGPARPGPLRPRRRTLGAACRQALHDRRRARPGGRRGGPFHGAADGAADRGLRPAAGRAGPRVGLARRRRRQRGDHPGLAAELRRLGGVVHTGHWVESLAELPPARAVLLDTSPRQFVAMAGPRLSRAGRPAVGSLSARVRAPARWTGPSTGRCPGRPRPAGARSRSTSAGPSTRWRGRRRRCAPAATPDQPFVLRGPALGGRPDPRPVGTAHAVGVLPRAERLGRRHDASGWRRRSSASRPASATGYWPGRVRTAAQAEAHNPNLLGGDINGGAATLRQTVFRPVPAMEPVPHSARGRVSLLGLDATRRRCARHVRRVGAQAALRERFRDRRQRAASGPG